MPFKPVVKKDDLITDLQNLFGTKFSTPDVRGFCASRNLKYDCITIEKTHRYLYLPLEKKGSAKTNKNKIISALTIFY